MDRDSLIKDLRSDGYLKTPRIIEAFEKIDRKDFILPEMMDEAYGNYPLPIGHGQTISQPLTVAFMIELLAPQFGDKILDVGSGSGWTTALLAYVVSQKGGGERLNVKSQKLGGIMAVERIPELCKFGEVNVRKYNFISSGIVKFFCSDGYRGAPKEFVPAGGFDKILASAAIESQRKSASSQRQSAIGDVIPNEWKKQLRVGGRIVAPVGQSVIVLDKISEKEFKEKEYFGFSFVPLIKGGRST